MHQRRFWLSLGAARGVSRLEPAGLFSIGMGGDVLLANASNRHIGGGTGDHLGKQTPCFTIALHPHIRFSGCKGRDHLPVVATRCAPADGLAFQQNHIAASLGQMQGSAQPREAATDHHSVGFNRLGKGGSLRTGWCSDGPRWKEEK